MCAADCVFKAMPKQDESIMLGDFVKRKIYFEAASRTTLVTFRFQQPLGGYWVNFSFYNLSHPRPLLFSFWSFQYSF